ncbi:MAG: glycoside hydrolase family 127 protein [Vicinamibacteria bacterium]|nr:glycoside hydrolase family 127 protein [Vicinamibacteria bacterium]
MPVSRRTLFQLGLTAGVGAGVPPWAEAVEGCAERATARAVRRLPLRHVRITGGPLLHAQEADAAYLLSLDVERLLAAYRRRAGIATSAAPYGGWDGEGRNLTGHIAGHYLSAVSLMWATSGDSRFEQRADALVSGLAEVQARHGDGYLGAIEGGRRAFAELARGEIRSTSFDLNGEWSPWYTLHKTFAGLRDAFRHVGNRTALDVEARFAAWADGVVGGLDAEQVQRMLNTEFGGMNEVLVDLFVDTRDERWLRLSYQFEHTAFLEPLMRHEDVLAGTHVNTQIPKLLGSLARFRAAGTAGDLAAAAFYWDRVTAHHSFATGGQGTDEYYGPPDVIGGRVDNRTAESCNVYNMLALTRSLFELRPDSRYADYLERALFNHALASIDPDSSRMCYMVPVGRGVQHEYQDMQRSFTCCVGTGMETHAQLGDGIYAEDGDRLWVNLYVPSTALWEAAGVRLAMETDFPEGARARLTLTPRAPREFTLALRRPHWAGAGFAVRVNGQAAALGEPPARPTTGPYSRGTPASTYVELKRTWQAGDVVELALPRSLRLEPTPDLPARAAILWGPLVLAADLGSELARGGDEEELIEPPPPAPVIVAVDPSPATWLVATGAPVSFHAQGVGRTPDPAGGVRDVTFVPFYRLHRRLYSVYQDVFSPEAWERERAALAAAAGRQRALEAATVGLMVAGEPESERAAGFESGPGTTPARLIGRPARRTKSWIAFDLPVDPNHPTALVVTYYSGDRRSLPASFVIQAEGVEVASVQLALSDPQHFFDATYPLPREVTAGKAKLRVRFEAREGSQVAALFTVRMVRSDQAPR